MNSRGSGELVQIPLLLLLLGVLALPSLSTRARKIERNEVRAGGEAEKIMRWRWWVILVVGRVRVRVLVHLWWCEELR